MAKTKIVLVNPPGGLVRQGMPLAFAYLKSNADAHRHDIAVVDCILDDIDPKTSDFVDRIRQIGPEVVGVTSRTFGFSKALAVIGAIKQIDPGIITVLGGAHATVAGEQIMEHEGIDFAFRGEAELSFPIFLDELKNADPDFSKVEGLIHKNEDGKVMLNGIARVKNLDDVKFPDYDSINLDRYIEKGYRYENRKERVAPIWSTRGCPYRCAFCSAPLVSGRIVRKHSVGYMLRWIELLYKKHNIRGFNVIDDNFTLDVSYAKAFCREVIEAGYDDIEFNSPNGVRMQRGDYELWTLMRKAGWRTIVVAPESGSRRVLRTLQKDLDPRIVPNVVRDMKRADLRVEAFIMVGCPGETRKDLDETLFLARKSRFNGISVSRFQPMAGTPIFHELLKRGEITGDFEPAWFQDYNSRNYVPSTLKDFDFSSYVDELLACLGNQRVSLIQRIRLDLRHPLRTLRHPLFELEALLGAARWVARDLYTRHLSRNQRDSTARAGSKPLS